MNQANFHNDHSVVEVKKYSVISFYHSWMSILTSNWALALSYERFYHSCNAEFRRVFWRRRKTFELNYRLNFVVNGFQSLLIYWHMFQMSGCDKKFIYILNVMIWKYAMI